MGISHKKTMAIINYGSFILGINRPFTDTNEDCDRTQFIETAYHFRAVAYFCAELYTPKIIA
jgi:hypothetical protein